jgi:hypothetical protein
MKHLQFKLYTSNSNLQSSPSYKNNPSENIVDAIDSNDLNKIKEKNTQNTQNTQNTYMNQLKRNMVGRINTNTGGCKTCGLR